MSRIKSTDLLRLFVLIVAATVSLACTGIEYGPGDDPAPPSPAGATLGYTTGHDDPAGPGQVKVLAFNTGHDWNPDVNARYAKLVILADFVKRQSIDIIALQERDYSTDGNSDGELLERAFAEVGYPMSVVQVPELKNEANVIASKHPFVAGTYGQYHVDGLNIRIVERIAVETPYGALWVINVHTHVKRPCEEAIEILGVSRDAAHWFAPPPGESVIVMGDFNLRLSGEDSVYGAEHGTSEEELNRILAGSYRESTIDPDQCTNFDSHIDWIISRSDGAAMLHSSWVDNEIQAQVTNDPPDSDHPVIVGLVQMQDASLPTSLLQSHWRGNEGWFRTVPLVGGDPDWGNAGAWGGPVPLDTLPGEGDMQAVDAFVSRNSLVQSFWRGGEGWLRYVPLVGGAPDWPSAGPWQAPVLLESLPGEGDVQAANALIVRNQVVQWFWRSNEGWFRTVPLVGGDPDWGSAGPWQGPLPIDTFPGSGDMQAGNSVVLGDRIQQSFWRGGEGWFRYVPIVGGAVDWGAAEAWQGPVPLDALPGQGDMQGVSTQVH